VSTMHGHDRLQPHEGSAVMKHSSPMRFIGDVHGKFSRYRELIRNVPASIQVGDMGVGFRRWPDGGECANPPHHAMIKGNHRFIRGNHDNPEACSRHSQFISDGHVEEGMMFVGGAVSIDREFRTEGFDWWPDEELSYAELYAITDKFVATKPRIMVSHECPESVADVMMALSGRRKLDWPSRTRQAFEAMWRGYHKPALWIFGHWHHSFDHVIEGTRFICLAELQHIDLEIGG
jgi:hypothetical protein